MKTFFTVIAFFFAMNNLSGQKNCVTYNYQQQLLNKNSALRLNYADVENFTARELSKTEGAREQQGTIIKIPVVIHVLYHYPNERDYINDSIAAIQIAILNQCFRKKNADTTLTPSYFKSLAADCEIEFVLATSDPQRRSTNGIIKKYSPIKEWNADDEMKFSSKMGSDAWDSRSYLNIWLCNLQRTAGYASMPGGDLNKDGVVLSFNVFGPNSSTVYDQGKTLVHEIGHWLNLKHLWGDEYCGDDAVADTPVQGGYNFGCPTGNHVTCNNGPNGDMYMNYMDFTNDACINMFTNGQKARMRVLFAPGGPRYGILSSVGLLPPLIIESPTTDISPKWLRPHLYPNPSDKQVILDLAYDTRWIGKIITIMNLQGQIVMQTPITTTAQVINVSSLQRGMYILRAKKEDGDFILEKFIKQ